MAILGRPNVAHPAKVRLPGTPTSDVVRNLRRDPAPDVFRFISIPPRVSGYLTFSEVIACRSSALDSEFTQISIHIFSE